ncbi:MAG: Pup--protein ligase [Propionibacteriaceae bacterium]
MRIYGIETEFGLTCITKNGHRPSAEESARYLFRPLTQHHDSTNVFRRNGARLYLDVGAHPEYATAECSELVQLLEHDRAGEELFVELAAQGSALLASEGIDGRLAMFKNNTDSFGNSYGCHENYLVSRVEDFDLFSARLLPFFVTRQLLCGAGKILVEDGVARFAVSQRAEHMVQAVSSATTRSRPMINTRDEPHADPRRWRRLHVIVGDANMAEPTTLLKVGSTELVLRLLESGSTVFDDLILKDPLVAIRDVARDYRGQARVQLANGRELSALELQRRYLDAASTLPDLDPVLDSVGELWAKVLDAIDSGNWSAIAHDIDWAIKLSLCDRYGALWGCDLSDPRMLQLDLAYHEITGSGIARLLERNGAIHRITAPEQVQHAMTTAPATTRAKLRGSFIAAAQDHQRGFTADWATLACTDLTDGVVMCPDPFATVDARVDRVIERMSSEPKTTSPYGTRKLG